MFDSKPALLSKGVPGALVAILAALAPLVGLTLSADDTAKPTEYGYELMIVVSNLIAVGGALIALIGRLRATKRIEGVVQAPQSKS